MKLKIHSIKAMPVQLQTHLCQKMKNKHWGQVPSANVFHIMITRLSIGFMIWFAIRSTYTQVLYCLIPIQVKDSYRHRHVHSGKSIRRRLLAAFESASGWVAAATIGILTACVAYLVDISEATVSDWKFGYCSSNPFVSRGSCCKDSRASWTSTSADAGISCSAFRGWSENWWISFAAYGGFALVFGTISSGLTMLTRAYLPAAAPGTGDRHFPPSSKGLLQGKSMYMAAGSGVPEIKTFLSGFEIPHLLTLKVLLVKAVGAIFAVSSSLSLGKEGPLVHISACLGSLVATKFPQYRKNSRKFRELLGAAVAAGMAVAFGAPIGGVLFAYEEIASYFPRKTLWRAFLCSASAAIILKELNPTGTGKLVLFETNYGTQYLVQHYLVFIALGIAGGAWGGIFCKLNFKWSKWFRSLPIIREHPVLEVFLVVLVTVTIQYPNPLTRLGGADIVKNNLVDCTNINAVSSLICQNESQENVHWQYIGWLVHGCATKLFLTTITFGVKVPSGVIIPALGAGSFCGRLLGQLVSTISPGVFAMVGAGAFLAGVSKMTISLCVILFELTGELEYILPNMMAILVAKWVSDGLSEEGIYDLAQSVLGHPFLDTEHAVALVQKQNPPHTLRRLVPPPRTLHEITINVEEDGKVSRGVLEVKLDQLKARGLMDAGLMVVQNDMLQGYLAQGELDYFLQKPRGRSSSKVQVRLLGVPGDGLRLQDPHDEERSPQKEENDISSYIDRTPLTMSAAAPMELVVECFGKLGLRHMIVLEQGSGKAVGVVIRKRLIAYLDSLH